MNVMENFDAQLYGGEAMVFSSDIWQFSYSSTHTEPSIGFIAEFQYHV